MKIYYSFFLLLLSHSLWSQNATSAEDRLTSVMNYVEADKATTINDLKFDNIGPTVFSGRVSDVEVDPDDPTHFYVAYASGGLWETTNNGTTFTPIFDHEMVITMGDIAVDWTNDIIWVGTGEVNSSRSSYAGVGMYKSSDNGKNWEHIGLEESHHIGKVQLHPTNPDIVWVAVLGHLYSRNAERGVYKTTDGGKTWDLTLLVDDKTGAVDLIMDKDDPNTLYAAMWERERMAWNFIESGEGSGIYKSTDGGDTWSLISTTGSGFPTGEGVGRIGLTMSGGIIYALLDNYNRRPKKEDDQDEGLTKNDLKGMNASDFENLENEEIEDFLRSNGFPKKHDAESVKKNIAAGKLQVSDLVMYLENANSLLFDTPVIGAELYKSTDGGKSWTKTHEEYLDGVYNSYGYYFGTVTADPSNADIIYVAGVPIIRSDDGGETFSNISGDNVHSDHHRIWINPNSSKHVINGNDGGINISYDSGETWIKCNSPSVGQFYYINTDNGTPYNVYGGTQDNGVWKGSHRYREGTRWHSTGQYPYKGIMGGDGMQVQIDSRNDNAVVYTGFQFGNYYRLNTKTGSRKYITPKHELGERPYRWNWQAPIHLSIHNEDIFYMGANKVFRSLDRGDNFEVISEDLTHGGKKGDVPYGTLATIHESPLQFGLLYVGSDDGRIHVTENGGHTWEDISTGLPKDRWVARVIASSHEKGRVYAAMNGYRNDDFTPYLYHSEDFGKTWTSIVANLPNEPINVVKEDPHHEDIIYVGTDRGVYVSTDRGESFTSFDESLPCVPVHDVVLQASAKDLLIGTHGRSIYRADLESFYKIHEAGSDSLMITSISSARYSDFVGMRRGPYNDFRRTEINYIVFSPFEKSVTITVEAGDNIVYESTADLHPGFNYLSYNTSLGNDHIESYRDSREDDADDLKAKDDGNYYLLKGEYTISLASGTFETSEKFSIK